ncbi:serine/threonine-protein kinase [Streptomyces sp. NPDC055243]|uniref:serine/threonine-protein kinase n=1 Tax=Streptomyces sp. NPDC055243 TaxID=3365720 RepID=UPI0037D15FA8
MAHGAEHGQLIGGRYRLVRTLGAGGMGRVWEAHDVQLRTDVAIKEVFLPPVMSPADRADRLERAIREARNAARLRDHPGIVTVHDVVIVDGVPWIVMELVTGATLQERLRAGRLTVDAVEEVATAVLRALEAAHRAGIVHRDIKPANVMVTADRRVLLTDFGVAFNEADVGLTVTGVVIGSAPYLSPERARGHKGNAASDLFSLGATLYEAVEGVSPFRRETVVGSQYAVVHEPAPPLRCAGRLAPLILGLLEKNPDGRPTASEALELLTSRAPKPTPTLPPTPKPPPSLPPTPTPTPPPEPESRPMAVMPSSGVWGAAGTAPPRPAATGPGRQEPARRKPRRGVVLGVVMALVLIGGMYGGYRWTQTQYFVGAHEGHVALYRGVDKEIGWVDLSTVEDDHPEIELKYLPAYQRKQVESAITEDGIDESEEKIEELAVQASACKKNEQARSAKSGSTPAPSLSEEEQKLVPLCGRQ